jgi:hypothetical protein
LPRYLSSFDTRIHLTAAWSKATAAGARVLVPPDSAEHRDAAIVQFPGGYIAEIHAPARP